MLIGLLCVLFGMHVYWFMLFLRLLWRIITDGELEGVVVMLVTVFNAIVIVAYSCW